MAVDLLKDRGTPLDRQQFTWRELVPAPYRKLNDDAFTRVRVIVMSALEAEAQRFSHAAARMNANPELKLALARVRRIEHHQQTLVNALHPPDQSALELTLGFEQAAVEVTAAVAQAEPDPYLAQVYRFGLLEHLDHLYRFAALYDRVEGKDANTLLQSYTDVLPGRPTALDHRAPEDDLRRPYDRRAAPPLSKLHAVLIAAAEQQTHDFYLTIGPMFADPVTRQVFAEIASIAEQHASNYESVIDADETWLEKWLLHEAAEVYLYHSCVESEPNTRVRAVWERFLDYELGHLAAARALFERHEGRDAAEVLPQRLPDAVAFESQRAFIRKVLATEVDLRANGTELVDRAHLPRNGASAAYREQLASQGSPSERVAGGYVWTPGTELMGFRRHAS